MIRKQFGVCWTFVICVSLSGCVWAPMLSNQWGENFALAPYGTEANHPALNDGNLETVGVVYPVNGERVFTLKFSEVKPVQKIIIHNENLFRFNVDYWDTETGEWKTVYQVRQRRDIGEEASQPKYVIERLNFRTNMLRINVSRTVDDRVVSRGTVGPTDKVVNQVRDRVLGHYVEYFRVVNPSIASVREVEVYHLVAK